jgi:hypothetical protein
VHVRVAANVVFRNVGDELVLLEYGRAMYYGLDPIGSRMWDLLVGGASTEEVVEILVGEYEVTREQLALDVERLVAELLELDLIVVA